MEEGSIIRLLRECEEGAYGRLWKARIIARMCPDSDAKASIGPLVRTPHGGRIHSFR